MKLIGILLALLIVGFLAAKQMKTTTVAPVIQIQGQGDAPAIQAQTPTEAANAVGAAAAQALHQGADQTAEKLKAAEKAGADVK